MSSEVIEGFPLSPQQKHLWALQQIDDGLAYRAQCAVLMEGPLDPEILRSAVQTVFARNEILHTSFQCPPGAAAPIQIVGQAVPLLLSKNEADEYSVEEQGAHIDALFREAGELRFDYEKEPLSHLSLVRLSSATHVLFVNLPSLCADAISLNNLVQEICAAYSTCPNQEGSSEQLLQYADLAEWQNELLGSPEAAKGKDYWRQQRITESGCLKLAIEDELHAKTGFVPNILPIARGYDIAAEIEALSRKYNTSAPAFLLACWQSLMWRLTGQSEFAIGVSCEGRTYEGLQRTFGLFAKSLPISARFEGDSRFDERLGLVEESLREARDWQEYFSWESLMASEAPGGSYSFCDVAFEYGSRLAKHCIASTTFAICRQYVCFDRFKLKLSCVEQEGEIHAELHYDSNLFQAGDVRRLGEQFLAFLRSAIANSGRNISELEILDKGERERLLLEFSGTESACSEYPRIHQLFEEQVDRTPNQVALVFGSQSLTYAQLNARANQVANYLRGLDVRPEIPVAICMDRCLEMVVGLIGILKAGGAYLPLDPAYPRERLAFMLEDARCQVVLTLWSLRERIPEQGVRLVCLDEDRELIAKESSANPRHPTAACNLAYVIYTSGSTGQPKGVMVEHRGLSNTIKWLSQTLAITGTDSTLLKTPITFDAAGREIYPTLLAGARLIIAEPNGHRDCRYIAERLRDDGISILHSVPSFLLPLIEEPAFADAVALRAVMCGGEVLTHSTVSRFGQRSSARLYNVYGPTETIIDSAYWLCGGNGDGSSVPIGRPIPNARMYILDPALRPAPIGVAGELHIGGVSLARGYMNRPDLTAEKFIPNPFANQSGERLYKTGDLARYRPDGSIQFFGRKDYQVKIRGVRIELGEIERALEQHPAVRQAIVIVHENELGERRLVSYVAAQPSCDPVASELRSFLREKLPEHLVPIAFIVLDHLPLTPNGKIDRQALAAPSQLVEVRKSSVGFRSPTEELVAGIWAQVLGVECVGSNDNFFDMGGHSLLATQLVSRIRETLNVEIPLRRVFETPTVGGLAGEIDLLRRAGQNLQVPPFGPISREGNLPLSFAQQRLWFIDQLDPGSSVYNFPVAVRLKGPLNLSALQRSLNEVVRRHETLRTTFTTVDGRPHQVIAPTLILDLPIVNLTALSEIDRENEVQRLATEEARRPFDLAQGPLLRASILQLGEEEQVGLLTMHHIVSDGWSTGILIREMAILYRAFCDGDSSPLPELTVQYADFAYWQRKWLQGPLLQTQIDYWKQQLSGSPPLLELPTDHPRPVVQTFRGSQQSLLLPKALSNALSALSRKEAATLFMTLLAAFKLLLRCYTSQEDLVVGSPIANRNRLEIEGLIGFFVNALALRTDLSGNPTFKEVLRRVREVCLSAYAHQDLPFDKLVEELRLERDLSRNPVFQVMFILQNAVIQKMDLPNLALTPVVADGGTTHFDLTLHIVDSDRGLIATAAFNTDLFDRATITRMLGHFHTLLEAIVTSPDRRLSELSLLTDAQRRQVVELGNNILTYDNPASFIHQLFESQVERTPDAIALVFDNDELTFRELNSRANQLAHRLRNMRVAPEIPVGVCLENSVSMVVGLLGILKAGGVYLPLDPAYPKERIAFMLEESHAPVLLTEERLKVELPEYNGKTISLDSDWVALRTESDENLANVCQHENLAYVIYTSGSTGQPKGVLVSHRAIADHCSAVQRLYQLVPDDAVLQCGAMSFDLSIEQILPTLISGARLIITRGIWRAAEFHAKACEFGLTVLNLPTGYWQELVREWAASPAPSPIVPYRLFVVGGDIMLPEVLRLWKQTPLRFIRLLNAYGPTEATITASSFDVEPRYAERLGRHRIPIGRPLPNREIYILDEDCNPAPIGVPGELCIGGPNLARGYLNQPDLTAERFIPDPYSNIAGARLYKTGDLARYLPDGNIEYIGRADHQVKIRGFRIELEEIEASLARHPSVRQVNVVTYEDVPGEKRLVAYVAGDREHVPTGSELRGFLMQKLPEYMVPTIFIVLDSVPTMPNGKLDRRSLPEPGHNRPEMAKVFVASRDDLETQLTRLWEEALMIRPIGVTDNFFELGGHSLLAVRLFALIETRLNKKLPLAALFQAPTVELLANLIRQNDLLTTASSLVPIQPAGSRRPLFLVHPAGGHVFPFIQLAQSLGPDQPCYGLQAKGVHEGSTPHTRIEEMAACYIEAVRSVQSVGPYLLGGWSMGGEIAFEMAQQLHAQQQSVAFLALLDARVPSPDEKLADEDFETTLLSNVVRYFGLSPEVSESSGLLAKDDLLSRVLEQGKRTGLLPGDLEVSQARRLIDLCKLDFRASRNYVMHRYPGRVTLFKASDDLSNTATDLTLGWGDWADGGVEIQLVPGNHANMVYKPNVEFLARKLTECIDRIPSQRLPSDRIKLSSYLTKESL